MCFYNNIKTLEKKTSTLIEDNLYTIDVNVIILQTRNQSNFSIRKLVVKINDIVLFISFSLLTFFILIDKYVKFCSFAKHVDQKPLKNFGEDLQEKRRYT